MMERATKKTDKKPIVKKAEKVEKEEIISKPPVIDEEKLEKIVKKETKEEGTISKPPAAVEIVAEVTEEREILLKNTGGSFHMGRRRIIKPGEKFKAKWSEIPASFRDTIYPLEDIPVKPSVPLLTGKKEEFILVPREDGFDVINKDTGKKINGKALPEETAKKLIVDLSK